MALPLLFNQIQSHPSNTWAKKRCYKPIYTASKKSRIVIVGQAPGKNAQKTSIPWNDASGETLRKWLNVSTKEFYDDTKIALLPMDFYYPGKNTHGDLPPRKDFAPLWHPQILKQMPNVELIILVGQYAQAYYLGKTRKQNLTQTVSAYQEYLPKYLPLVHPSPLNFRWQSKNPWFQKDVIPEVQKIVRKILTQ